MPTLKEQRQALRRQAEETLEKLLRAQGKQYLLVEYITLQSEHNDKFINGVAIDPCTGELAMITSENTFWSMGEVEDENVFEVLELLEAGEFFPTLADAQAAGYFDEPGETPWFIEAIEVATQNGTNGYRA